ncbi:hypothetical protein RHMOL_Rhmol09G0047600 [Rhododendron molle]|uniref:Uncharacterized protein n=1 Tax=Rhododendron molle TaxID=49168 RepID=A0ACC0M9U4_RHOML|nr:hypothetical protein RHMOL_Rhmol09G0047600 [Rhododendron molle]
MDSLLPLSHQLWTQPKMKKEEEASIIIECSKSFSQTEKKIVNLKMGQSVKPILSPVPDEWFPTLAVLMLAIGLIVTASLFMQREATHVGNGAPFKKNTGNGVPFKKKWVMDYQTRYKLGFSFSPL